MKRTISRALKRVFWVPYAAHKLFFRPKSYLHTTGWVESLKRSYPCDKDGADAPWMNLPVVQILRERLNKDMALFEFGSGYSTLFYAGLVGQVISLEHDRTWFDLMTAKIPANASLIYRDKDTDGKYCRAIAEFDQEFDVVIIDGRDRVNCLEQALGKLSAQGVIVFDDSAREIYSEALDRAASEGFRALGIEGLKPRAFGLDRTTLLYRDGNCLGI